MYTSLENAYNDNTSDLDKMAKALNKKKDNFFRSQDGEFDRVEKKWNTDIYAYNNYMNTKDKPILEEEKYVDNNYNINNKFNNNSDDYSLDSISIDSPTIDSYIETIKSEKHKTSPMHKIIEELNNEDCSKDNEDIYEHIKTCKECKIKLLKYITNNHKNRNRNRNSNSNKINENNKDYYEDIYRKRKSLFNYFGEIENKEIIVIVMLGIFMIILLDFMMKGVKNKL